METKKKHNLMSPNLFYSMGIVLLSWVAIPSAIGQSSFFFGGGAYGESLANIGSVLTGIEAAYANPAGITAIDRLTADVSYDRRYNLSGLSTISAGAGTSWKKNHLALSIIRFGDTEYSESKLGLSIARKLFNNLSVGGTFDVVRYQTQNYGTATKFIFEVGVLSKLSESFSLGFHVFNPGIISIGDDYDIPTKLAIGSTYKAGKKTKILMEISKSIDHAPEFKLAVVYEVIKNLTLQGGANITHSSFHFGSSYSLFNGLGITAGYAFDNRLGSSAAISLSWTKPSKKQKTSY